MPYTYDYPRPAVTVDIVILAPLEKGYEILLIQRKFDPFKEMWALPGGFLDMDEELIDAAARELEEETSVTNAPLKEIGTFGKIGRDPRGRTVSVVFMGKLSTRPDAKAGDDAAEIGWFPLLDLPKLAFDHQDIINRVVVIVAERER